MDIVYIACLYDIIEKRYLNLFRWLLIFFVRKLWRWGQCYY